MTLHQLALSPNTLLFPFSNSRTFNWFPNTVTNGFQFLRSPHTVSPPRRTTNPRRHLIPIQPVSRKLSEFAYACRIFLLKSFQSHSIVSPLAFMTGFLHKDNIFATFTSKYIELIKFFSIPPPTARSAMPMLSFAPSSSSPSSSDHLPNRSPPKEHWIAYFTFGGIAGVVSKSVMAPFDRVKILFQTRNPHYQFSGVFGTLGKIVETEGASKLWKGNMATVIRVFPYASIQFMSYEKYKLLFIGRESQKESHPFLSLIAGSCAGATAVLLTYPLDLIRARLASQVNHDLYKNTWHGLYLMWQQEGPKSWFKGLRATLQGILPYAGINFSVFETLKFYAPKDERGELTIFWRLLCGAIAGPIGQTISYPWDTIRRRQQTWGFAVGTNAIKSTSTLAIAQEIIRVEGLRGLFKGISINYLKASPTIGITFMVYETLKSQYSRYVI